MATIKLVQRTNKTSKNGTAPIFLRITENRKTRFISTGIRILVRDWNPDREEVRKSDPDFQVRNDELKLRKREAESTAFRVRQKLNGKGSATAVKNALVGKSVETLTGYMEAYLEQVDDAVRYWDGRNIRVALKKLRDFAGRADIEFSEVDTAFVNRFDAWMEHKLKNGANTRAKNLSILKRVFRRAVDEKVIGMADNPLFNFKIRTAKVSKGKLSIEEVRALAQLDLSGEPAMAAARDAFLFAFYVAGIRFGDLCTLRGRDVNDGRLHYTMKKTGTTKAVKLSEQAVAILARYVPHMKTKDDFIFPLLDGNREYTDGAFLRRQISSKNVMTNRYLQMLADRIETPVHLSFHIARHSFADYARRSGHAVYDISKALGHSKLQTTQTYLAGFDQGAEDGMIEKLFCAS